MSVWTPPGDFPFSRKIWGLYLRNQVLSRRLTRSRRSLARAMRVKP